MEDLIRESAGLAQEGMAVNVSERFSNYSSEIRDQVRDLLEDIEELSEEEVDNGITSILSMAKSKYAGELGEISEGFSLSIFPEDFELDGPIDTFKELKKVLDEVADTYKALSDAQKEQANNGGKLSTKTLLDLLTANENYLYALDFEIDETTGAVTAMKLKTDATEILAKVELEAAKAGIQKAIAEETESIATQEARMAELMKIIAEYDETDATIEAGKAEEQRSEGTKNAIVVANKAGKVFTDLTGVMVGLAQVLSAIAGGDFTAVKTAFETGKAAVGEWVDTVLPDVVKQTWDTFTRKYTPEDIDAMKKEVAEMSGHSWDWIVENGYANNPEALAQRIQHEDENWGSLARSYKKDASLKYLTAFP